MAANIKLLLFVALLSFVSFACAASSNRKLAFALPQQNLAQLERIFWDRSNPNSPNYGKWMSLDEISRITGALQADVEAVEQFLKLVGAKNIALLPSREYLLAELPDTTAKLLLKSLGHPHASAKAVVDLARAGHVGSSILLSDSHINSIKNHLSYVMEVTAEPLGTFPWRHIYSPGPRRQKFKVLEQLGQVDSKSSKSVPTKIPFQFGAYGDPNSQKDSYGMPKNLVGSNSNNSQAVWGPGTFGYLPSDLQSFYSAYSVPGIVSKVKAPYYQGTPGGDNFGEGTLDTTYISSMAPNVATYVLNTNTSESTEESPGFGYALENFLLLGMAQTQNVPWVLSMSLGSLSWDSCNMMCNLLAAQGKHSYKDCLYYVQYTQRQVCMMDNSAQVDRINTEFMKLGLRGVTLLAATGDGGSHFSFQPFGNTPIGQALNKISCQYNFPTFPAASPYVLGVGGTDWPNGPSQPTAWSASGSGFSWRFPRPSYQDAVVTNYLKTYSGTPGFPSPGSFNATNRAYPDVASLANGIPMYMQGWPTVTGGTSASTPAFAGILSMINDARFNAGKPSLGFVNPRIYQAAAQNPGKLFYDITEGNSACQSNGACCSEGFPATPGWDPTTGLGSPIWSGLLEYLGN